MPQFWCEWCKKQKRRPGVFLVKTLLCSSVFSCIGKLRHKRLFFHWRKSFANVSVDALACLPGWIPRERISREERGSHVRWTGRRELLKWTRQEERCMTFSGELFWMASNACVYGDSWMSLVRARFYSLSFVRDGLFLKSCWKQDINVVTLCFAGLQNAEIGQRQAHSMTSKWRANRENTADAHKFHYYANERIKFGLIGQAKWQKVAKLSPWTDSFVDLPPMI